MRYWLFKTEPGCFSFDDLRQRPNQTEHWDGVRNFQARNFLRDEVSPGDGVLFYHSNIPEPAIVGIAEAVTDGYPDWTARDPGSEHFDPRASLENPIWYMVDVRYVRPLARPVTLAELKTLPELAGMVLLSRSRLSIQPVSREEWDAILRIGVS
jgi:predicted RNA-binding protein with PUA-like domain